MPEPISIILPSFLRRTMKAYALKAKIRNTGCELNRVGRSRNWQLKATTEQLLQIIEQIETSDESSWQWLAKHLSQHKQQFTYNHLLTIAQKRPEITVNELISLTDCTVAEARKVLDALEDWE